MTWVLQLPDSVLDDGRAFGITAQRANSLALIVPEAQLGHRAGAAGVLGYEALAAQGRQLRLGQPNARSVTRASPAHCSWISICIARSPASGCRWWHRARATA